MPTTATIEQHSYQLSPRIRDHWYELRWTGPLGSTHSGVRYPSEAAAAAMAQSCGDRAPAVEVEPHEHDGRL